MDLFGQIRQGGCEAPSESDMPEQIPDRFQHLFSSVKFITPYILSLFGCTYMYLFGGKEPELKSNQEALSIITHLWLFYHAPPADRQLLK